VREKDRRRHERVSLPYKIILTLQDETVEGSLKDISACGASCYIEKKDIKKEIPLGCLVSFVLASDTSYLKFEGTVVRIEEENEKKFIGITFY
jgi:c-di-GMP-binding flagellar brake protein YcgR